MKRNSLRSPPVSVGERLFTADAEVTEMAQKD
jgi:hypothetical protein